MDYPSDSPVEEPAILIYEQGVPIRGTYKKLVEVAFLRTKLGLIQG